MQPRRSTLLDRVVIFMVAVMVAAGVQTTSAQEAEYLWSVDESVWRGTSIGEAYTIELTGGLWNPTPALIASSEQFGILGSDIDFGRDLGLVRSPHPEFRLTLKPGRRHKFRISSVPIQYTQRHVLERRLVFQGIAYDVGIPVASTLRWDAWRVGYEFDMIVRERGYLGLILEAKYTRLQAELTSDIAHEYLRAQAPIPAGGLIARVYPTRFTPITAEFTAFKLPESLSDDYRARYTDFDIYGTLNLSRMFGINLGYRSLDFNFLIDDDRADLRLDGMYLSGVFRY